MIYNGNMTRLFECQHANVNVVRWWWWQRKLKYKLHSKHYRSRQLSHKTFFLICLHKWKDNTLELIACLSNYIQMIHFVPWNYLIHSLIFANIAWHDNLFIFHSCAEHEKNGSCTHSGGCHIIMWTYELTCIWVITFITTDNFYKNTVVFIQIKVHHSAYTQLPKGRNISLKMLLPLM